MATPCFLLISGASYPLHIPRDLSLMADSSGKIRQKITYFKSKVLAGWETKIIINFCRMTASNHIGVVLSSVSSIFIRKNAHLLDIWPMLWKVTLQFLKMTVKKKLNFRLFSELKYAPERHI
jgi:hypothetical protein